MDPLGHARMLARVATVFSTPNTNGPRNLRKNTVYPDASVAPDQRPQVGHQYWGEDVIGGKSRRESDSPWAPVPFARRGAEGPHGSLPPRIARGPGRLVRTPTDVRRSSVVTTVSTVTLAISIPDIVCRLGPLPLPLTRHTSQCPSSTVLLSLVALENK